MRSGPILLTGARGFVGRHVHTRALDRELDLVAATCDLLDPAATLGEVERVRPSAVIHVAARPRAGARPWQLLVEELQMAGNLLRAVSEAASGATVLIPGSAGQYGLAAERPLTESDPLSPVNAYATMKCALETVATSRSFAGAAEVIWARPFNIVGPGQGLDAPVPAWASQIAELERAGGGPLRTGNLDVVRDFLDVRDVADAFLDLATSDFHGVVNVGSGIGVSLREVVDQLVAQAAAPIAVEPDPALARRVDPGHVVADVTRLRALTGFAPRFALHDSLGAVLREWRAQPVHTGAA